MPFGQVVMGPPGSGKTTYCHGMLQVLQRAGRQVAVVNLDPGNDSLPYEPAVDISELVELTSVMEELKLGPNGGLIYCMDYLAQNMDWLKEKLMPLEQAGMYFLFDLPGQAELFTMHTSMKAITTQLTNEWHYRLAAVNLVDAHLCTDAHKYVSALLMSLSSMLHLELPAVNILSKIDLIRQYGKLDFQLDFYTEVQDLSFLVRAMGETPFAAKHRKLTEGLCEVVQDFSLLRFIPLAVQDEEAMLHVLGIADKQNGFVFGGLAGRSPYPPEFIYGSSIKASDSEMWELMAEKYVDGLAVKEAPAP